MKKHKNIMGVAFLLLVGISTLFPTMVNAKEDSCVNAGEMKSIYLPNTEFKLKENKVVVSVKKGKFKVYSINEETPGDVVTKQSDMGILSPNSPMEIKFDPSGEKNGDSVSIRFVLAEDSEGCKAWDTAEVNKSGNKVQTYYFDVKFILVDTTRRVKGDVSNTNRLGICQVLVNGVNYDKYKNKLNGLSKDMVDKYNAAADSNAEKFYKERLNYCFVDLYKYDFTEEQTARLISSVMKAWSKISAGTGNANNDAGWTQEDEKKIGFAKRDNHFYDKINVKVDADDGTGEDNSDNGFNKASAVLTCDWKKQSTTDDYYANKQYFYATQETTTNVTYDHKYTSGITEPESAGSCKRTCEEIVTVEYGPPIATKAGLCFEYKVKVSSKVRCETAINITPPSLKDVCYPVPYCNSIPGYANQGGPNEDFENCVLDCDGGKYTQKCSNKCYNKVYGKSSSSSLQLSYGGEVAPTNMALSIEEFNRTAYQGRYTMSKNGTVAWSGPGYATWYKEYQTARTYRDDGEYSPDGSGFKRHNLGGYQCDDPCNWDSSSCSVKDFLNEDEAMEDYVKQMKEYNDKIGECKAKASCVTTTAEFTISASYDHKDNSGKVVRETIKYPYEIDKSTSSVKSQGITCSGDADKNDTAGIILDYAGCYKNCSQRNNYMTEWSFPGTWINNKTGEISYKKPTSSVGWHNTKNKFCTPLDALSVNTKWWEWKEINDKCYDDVEKEIKEELGDPNDEKSNWNIRATAKKFGYFKWNFNIACFYGLRNEECDVSKGNGCCKPVCDPRVKKCDDEDDKCEEEGTCDTVNNYKFRNVDLSDLFPTSGDIVGTSSKVVGDAVLRKLNNNNNNAVITGRTPGYNWSSAAKNLNNSNYPVDPDTLIKDIQEKGNDIYSGTYEPDYYFVLDKQTLASIRSYNRLRNDNYSRYGILADGTVDNSATREKNGITVYSSKFLRNSGYFSGATFGELGVNNQKDTQVELE